MKSNKILTEEEANQLMQYLPYDLNCVDRKTESVQSVMGIIDMQIVLSIKTIDFKPVLRKLSAGPDPILIDGKRLIPFMEVKEWVEYYKKTYPGRRVLDNHANAWAICQHYESGMYRVEDLSYKSVQILLKYHFDIFDFIKKGIAYEYKDNG